MKEDLTNKITVGLERISEVFKTLLWEKAKVHGISPIQIQILLFIDTHKPELCSVSHLAKEFNLTKPTISDAVKVLDKKGLVKKDYSPTDNRSYILFVSEKGKKLLKELSSFSSPLKKELDKIEGEDLSSLYSTLTKLIYQLNQSGVLTVQRTCFGCRFYVNKSKSHYCNLLQKPLIDSEIRLDCDEFEER